MNIFVDVLRLVANQKLERVNYPTRKSYFKSKIEFLFGLQEVSILSPQCGISLGDLFDETLLKPIDLSSFNWPLLSINFKETSEAKTRREREDLNILARVRAPIDEASRGGWGLFS